MSADLLRDGAVVTETPVRYAGKPSLFETELPELPAGSYQLRVVAADAAAVNFGVATAEFVVRERASKE
jgi:hypothetical protein